MVSNMIRLIVCSVVNSVSSIVLAYDIASVIIIGDIILEATVIRGYI